MGLLRTFSKVKLTKSNVLVRVDASLVMGTGHVMRCLTLADALTADGMSCTFVCREFAGHMCNLIETRGHKVARLPSPAVRLEDSSSNDGAGSSPTTLYAFWLGVSQADDARDTLMVLAGGAADVVVVDHYALGAEWESSLRAHCETILAIDDLADRDHDCDVLLDQNLGRLVTDYDGLVPLHCQRLIGPRYALLRPEFAVLRSESLARRSDGKCRHILVTMGGVDSDNATGLVLTALESACLAADMRVTVVLGASAPWKESVQIQAQGMRLKTEIVVNATNMAELMRDADLAIGAAGSTSWERCCMGLPTLQLVLADNQRQIARALDSRGAAVSIERHRLAESIGTVCANLLRDPRDMIAMSNAAASVTEGLGATRVAESLMRGVVA